ncbi:reverse transcriptase domain-containing protein [Tanacetum coccineum]|uniref:Reverse transcriptase domain-containing protein n=1 Tax=Tanacetum coccineum TaxID=301880 RepID=A0ABQ5AEY4_9ASTR
MPQGRTKAEWETSKFKQAEAAFKQMKKLIAELPMLAAPKEKEELIVYLAAAKEAISAVLMTDREGKQVPIYFVSHALRGPEINYTPMEKLEDSPDEPMTKQEEIPEPWTLLTDGSSCIDGFGAGLILTNPKGVEFMYAMREFSIKQVPRSENKKADALSKIASTSFAHLSKQVLVEELKEKSINEKEILAIVEEEGNTWMTPICEYLTKEILSADKKEARAIRHKAVRVRGTSFRPGDMVYHSNDASHARDGGKLGPKWEGPYEVAESLGKGAYKLKDCKGNKLPRTWNICNLKKCYVHEMNGILLPRASPYPPHQSPRARRGACRTVLVSRTPKSEKKGESEGQRSLPNDGLVIRMMDGDGKLLKTRLQVSSFREREVHVLKSPHRIKIAGPGSLQHSKLNPMLQKPSPSGQGGQNKRHTSEVSLSLSEVKEVIGTDIHELDQKKAKPIQNQARNDKDKSQSTKEIEGWDLLENHLTQQADLVFALTKKAQAASPRDEDFGLLNRAFCKPLRHLSFN